MTRNDSSSSFAAAAVAAALTAGLLSAQTTDRDHLRTNVLAQMPWQQLGPVQSGGRVVDIAVNPQRPQEYWLAAASGGLWAAAGSPAGQTKLKMHGEGAGGQDRTLDQPVIDLVDFDLLGVGSPCQFRDQRQTDQQCCQHRENQDFLHRMSCLNGQGPDTKDKHPGQTCNNGRF